MLTGTNWSGTRELKTLEELIANKKVDFIEILIDNFLCCTPQSILEVVGDIPIAFHVMNSMYLHKDTDELLQLSNKIKFFMRELNPLYISDHIGLFYQDGYPLPKMCEVNYESKNEELLDKIDMWQNMIGTKVLFENYASILNENASLQFSFFERMMKKIGCGLIFDISNAVIAEYNTGARFDDWLALDFQHMHIGGYEKTSFQPSFLVDTHATTVSSLSLSKLNKVKCNERFNLQTLSVERDDNFYYEGWVNDIEICRK